MSCIFGALLYCSGVFTIPGPIAYAPTYRSNDPWRYAAWYQPPLLTQPSFPLVFPVSRRG